MKMYVYQLFDICNVSCKYFLLSFGKILSSTHSIWFRARLRNDSLHSFDQLSFFDDELKEEDVAEILDAGCFPFLSSHGVGLMLLWWWAGEMRCPHDDPFVLGNQSRLIIGTQRIIPIPW